MSNTIHSAFTGGIGQTNLQKTASTPSNSRSSEVNSTNVTADNASISSASANLTAALKTDDARTDRVGAIRASIAAGTYNVDPSAVADKIIDSILK